MLRLNLSATYETTNCRCHFATYNRFSPCSFLSWCVRVLYLPRTVPSFSCCCWTVSHHSRNISAVGEWQDFFLVERGRRAGKRTSAQQPSCIIEIRRYSVRLSNPNSRDSGRVHLYETSWHLFLKFYVQIKSQILKFVFAYVVHEGNPSRNSRRK